MFCSSFSFNDSRNRGFPLGVNSEQLHKGWTVKLRTNVANLETELEGEKRRKTAGGKKIVMLRGENKTWVSSVAETEIKSGS